VANSRGGAHKIAGRTARDGIRQRRQAQTVGGDRKSDGACPQAQARAEGHGEEPRSVFLLGFFWRKMLAGEADAGSQMTYKGNVKN